MSVPIVFFDIAGDDEVALQQFYANVFDWKIGGGARFTVNMITPMQATIRKDPAEKVLYMGVPDILTTQEVIRANGGTIEKSRFEVPGVVVLALFSDPAGNRMGLVEMDGEVPKIP